VRLLGLADGNVSRGALTSSEAKVIVSHDSFLPKEGTMKRSTLEALRACVDQLEVMRAEMEAAGVIVPLEHKRPALRVIEGGETWVHDPEGDEYDA
jgi:uridine phosphorylase